ncbi:hypothetical protein X975_04172, partial [Stegodyphus mimosarum]
LRPDTTETDHIYSKLYQFKVILLNFTFYTGSSPCRFCEHVTLIDI